MIFRIHYLFLRESFLFRTVFIIMLIAGNHHVIGQDALPQVHYGEIVRLEHFQSKFISSRHVDIWLPPGYSQEEKYSVLYMHDGQMLFDASQTWNHQSWQVSETATEQLSQGSVKPFIVVGIWNGGKSRHLDYFPQKPFEKLSQEEKDSVSAQLQRAGRIEEAFQPQSDQYLKFLTRELKPYIDNHYSVYTDNQHTYIAGSSMGGLISLYAICEYPEVFGGAACMSTHWIGTFSNENNPIPAAFLTYLESRLPHLNRHKLYFDCGDETLDAMYIQIQHDVDDLIKSKRNPGLDWVSHYWVKADHSERAWSKRFAIPLQFLIH